MTSILGSGLVPLMSVDLWIKICGINHPDDARRAVEFGADALGLNFYPPSPRYVDVATAQTILREIPNTVAPVGVLVQPQPQELRELAIHLPGVETIQWHGLGNDVDTSSPMRLLPAFSIKGSDSLPYIIRCLDHLRDKGMTPFAILVDAHVPGLFGGTGQTAPWNLLADFDPGVPMILAGGLTPDNVALAIRIVQPFGVDVASGVEDASGRKDLEKMRRFIHNAREAVAKLSESARRTTTK